MHLREFPHKAPKGYSYSFEEFKRNVIRIWIHDSRVYDYNNGEPVKCIWGFYNSKKQTYFAPINSSTVGKEVPIECTRPYTAMQIKQTPLESAFT
jgi:hypothetical protein